MELGNVQLLCDFLDFSVIRHIFCCCLLDFVVCLFILFSILVVYCSILLYCCSLVQYPSFDASGPEIA